MKKKTKVRIAISGHSLSNTYTSIIIYNSITPRTAYILIYHHVVRNRHARNFQNLFSEISQEYTSLT